MAISTTTFDERIARINKGETVDRAAIIGKSAKRRTMRSRLFTVPCLTGIGILTGLPAYAWASTKPDVVAALGDLPTRLPQMQQWVVALAG